MNATHAHAVALVADFQAKQSAARAQYPTGEFPRSAFRDAWITETAARLRSIPAADSAGIVAAVYAWGRTLGSDDLYLVESGIIATVKAMMAIRQG